MELKKNMENKFTVWTNVMWFCLGVGAVILFAIATTPTHAQAQVVIKGNDIGTTSISGVDKAQYLGTNFNGVITEINTFYDKATGSPYSIYIFQCDTYNDDPTLSQLNSGCTQGFDVRAELGYSSLDPTFISNGVYKFTWSSIDLTSQLDGQALILLPLKHVYLWIDVPSSSNIVGTNYNSIDGWWGEETNNEDARFIVKGTSFIGPSYIYNKQPTGIYATSTVPISYYYALAPSDNVVQMELRLSQAGYSTVIAPITYTQNTGSTTQTFNMPSGNWTASVWFTNTNGYEWTCTTCSWTFTVIGSIYDDVLLWGTSTVSDLVNLGAISTSTLGSQYQCGSFGAGNFDLGSCLASVFGNIFGLASNALTEPATNAYNSIIALPIFSGVQQTGTLFSNWSSSTVATSSADTLTLAYNEMGASNTVTVLWDDVSNLSIVQEARGFLSWLLYLTLGLAIVSFMFFVLVGKKDI